jgi:peroxiredoxin
MTFRSTSLAGGLIIMIAMAVFTGSAGTPFPSAAEIGKPAPAFTLTDVAGKSHQLSDFKGKLVVLEWTNPGCPFVQRVYTDGIMTSVQKEYVAKGVVWLTINSTNTSHRDFLTPEALKEKFGSWKAGFTALLVDSDGKVGKQFDAKTTPHMYIVDKEGKLVYNGAIDDDPRGENDVKVNYVKQALDLLLSGKAIATSSTKPYGCSVKY